MATVGSFYWNELLTSDPAAAAAFFQQLLGWTSEEMPMPQGVYRVMKKDGHPVAGIMAFPPGMPAGVPPHWEAYVTVADVDASMAEAERLGGHVIRSPSDIPGVGRIGIFKDPQGAVLCLITPTGAG